MSVAIQAFEKLLYQTLIPEFANAPDRGMHPSSFRGHSFKVSEFDAEQFLRAWDFGMLKHYERGRYRFRKSGSIEQFFSSGPKSEDPRPFGLWLEPIIAVGAMCRLHLDFGWPEHRIATQSFDGAFDVIALRPEINSEWIAGEVKKTKREIEHLINLMRAYGRNPNALEPASGPKRNAFKKVVALRKRQPPIFWAIGPDSLSEVFKLEYGSAGEIELSESRQEEMIFSF